MRYEVEQKFRVTGFIAVERQLTALGAGIAEPQGEVDRYFAHPARDFAQTDEALRIRRGDKGASVTYKGPKVDATTKTRREIDLPLDSARFDQWDELLRALGFTAVAEVVKQRRKAFVDWEGRRIEVSLDEVRGVGTYVELEVVTEEQELAEARETIASLARHLGLSENERRSYLELLLKGQGA